MDEPRSVRGVSVRPNLVGLFSVKEDDLNRRPRSLLLVEAVLSRSDERPFIIGVLKLGMPCLEHRRERSGEGDEKRDRERAVRGADELKEARATLESDPATESLRCVPIMRT